MEKVRASISPSQNYGPKSDGIAEGVRMTAENIMDPTCPMLLPCGTAARVTPTFYTKEIVLSPTDVTEEFSGVIVLRPRTREFLSVNIRNGNAENVTAATLAGMDGFDLQTVEALLDNYYFPAFWVESSTGVRVGKSALVYVGDPTIWGQDSNTGAWLRGYAACVEATCGASSNANYSNLIFGTGGANFTCTVYVGQIDTATGAFTFFASTANAAGATSGAFADLAGTTGNAVGCAIKVTTDVGGVDVQVRMRVGSIDLVDYDPIDFDVGPAPASDVVFDALNRFNTGARMSAASLLLGYRGSKLNDAGIIGVASMPEGIPLPSDPRAVYDLIGRLPYDAYTGPVNKGGHVFWRPKTLRDILFKQKVDALEHSNMLVIAFVIPPSDGGQISTLSLKAKSVWEWIYDSQSMPQYRAPSGWNYLEALYAVIGQFNPAGENPAHLAKIKAIAKKVAANPTVKLLAKQALDLGISTAKKVVLPALMGIAL